MVRTVGTLIGKYDQRSCENKCALLIFLIIIFFYHKNLTFHWIIIILIGGKYHYEINVFLKYMLDTITGTPLEVIMSKIYLKYIPIHIHNFEHTSGIMNMKLSSHGFLFHRNII